MNFFRRADSQSAPTPAGGRTTASAFGVLRPITASARQIDKSKLSSKPIKYRDWQREAWNGYDAVGEIHYGYGLLADTFSRIRLYAGAITSADQVPLPIVTAEVAKENEDEAPTPVQLAAKRLLEKLANVDFSSQIRTFAISMSVAGECLLLQLPTDQGGEGKPGSWVFRSTDEVKVESDKIRLVPSATGTQNEETTIAVKRGGEWTPDIKIGRIWRQHPRFTDEPDSSMKALSDPIAELLLVSRLIRTITRARLNAGLLFLPDGISAMSQTAAPEGGTVDPDGNVGGEALDDRNQFVAELIDAMVSPIENEDATSSVVPSVVTGPLELGAGIRHITLDRKSDEWLTARAASALERILQGIDLPKDMVTGLANVKYSNAIQIDHSFWKSNVEPMALMLSDALTDIYLRPELIAAGFSEAEAGTVCVWYDPSEVVTKPDQSDDASVGYDKFLLNGAAWRRVHGFSDEDAPNETELAMQLLFSKGTLPEDVTAAILSVALPKLLGTAREENAEGRIPDSAADILRPSEQQESPAPEGPEPTSQEG